MSRIITKQDVQNVMTNVMHSYIGYPDTQRTRDKIDAEIKQVLSQYMAVGINVDDILNEIELDDMFDKLDKLEL